MDRLRGRVAIVTGGAKGIGRGIAEVFAEEGAHVALFDVDDDSGTATAQALGGHGSVHYFSCDVSDEAQIIAAVDFAAAALGPPTVLVNNAGVFVFKGVDATIDDWTRVLAVNVIGTSLVTKHVVPHMRRAGGGSVVNLGSVSSFIAQEGFMTYSATKAAVSQMTRCMALDLSKDNIRVNAVCPGAVWSDAVRLEVDRLGLSRQSAADLPNLGKEQLIHRLADPREIGYAALFLASDESSFVTGTNLVADGGWTVR